MSSSDLSELSSALSIEDDILIDPTRGSSLDLYFKNRSIKAESVPPPAKKKRPVSPPHEYVLADNPDIAVSSSIIKAALHAEVCLISLKFAALMASPIGHLHVSFSFQ